MLSTLATIAGLATFVLGILVAIKMFQANLIWQGVVTILCALFGVIYGWQKKDQIGAGSLMLPYTICFIAGIVLNIMARVMVDAGPTPVAY